MKVKIVTVLMILGIVSLWGGSLSDFEQKEVQQKQTEIKYMFNDPGTS
ncbi:MULTISPECIES: hypothetical protein [Bacillus]|nr:MULTISPECIES: hypothetical protein [Bacillus cereus group]HEF1855777.1 hypothetical protein [Bacillus cereus]MDA1676825.1 hypothetical protein [Bacillus cereus group sp. TH152-1LC]MED3393031.1 hypothetical protein [Bacillus thuringiensis]HEF1868215.1 hypothetical protein [Bacillus cereus]HEF1878752.1 hypothetical protein [Bacillus cereus]